MKNVSIIGIGRLGLCFALTLERAGYNVLGMDINQEYVDSVNDKTLVSHEHNVSTYLNESSNFSATTSLSQTLNHSDVIYVVVATPSLENGRYDHSQVERVVESIKTHGAVDNKHLVICCTTMPQYCDTVQDQLASFGYTVSYNPEFIAQGTILRDQAYPDMVLIGEGSPQAGDILEEMYQRMTLNEPRIHRMSRTEAEITKIGLNCFLTTKISYANMIGDIVTRSGGCPDTVLGAIGDDTRVGNKYIKYGYGYGGPCFPRDNRVLALYAQDLSINALISKASDQSNEEHLSFQVNEFIKNNDTATPVRLSRVTYKPESTLLVESQQLAFAVGVASAGFKVTITERPVVIQELKSLYGDLFHYEEE